MLSVITASVQQCSEGHAPTLYVRFRPSPHNNPWLLEPGCLNLAAVAGFTQVPVTSSTCGKGIA